MRLSAKHVIMKQRNTSSWKETWIFMGIFSKNAATGKLHLPSIIAGAICLVICFLLTAIYQVQHTREERLQMEYIARTIESETYETLLLQMDNTKVLKAYLMETGGSIDSFGPIAEDLLRGHAAVQNVLFAPNGIVTKAFPKEGNEETIGLDLNRSGQGNWEAQAAIRTGELFLAGPFELVEGGMGICGRLPVYLDGEYWGLVSVTLRYPAVFMDHPIHHVNAQGFACQVWRINPDTNQKQVILDTEKPITDRMKTTVYKLRFFNADWNIEIAALTAWYQRPIFWVMLAASLFVSTLISFGVEAEHVIRKMRTEEAAMQIENLRQQLEWEQTGTMLNQISTHFFYHTLNAIQALIVLEPDSAYKMAGDFSRYLRFNVDAITASGGIVSFKEELRSVRAYAEINELQLEGRLRMEFDIPDVDFQMPALTLQPIVENAILHGIKPTLAGGTVKISLKEDERNWYITVTDNGQGFDPTQAEKKQSVGLANVRKRIEKFEGCSLEIVSAPGNGTTAVLIYKKI